MAQLLAKFRIDYSDVILISDLLKPPEEASKLKFKKIIEQFIVTNTEEYQTDTQMKITEADLIRFRDKVFFVF